MRTILLACLIVATTGCEPEKRMLEADQPLSAPVGSSDPRIEHYRDNVFEIAQGGRYFSWYGCGGCHDAAAPATLDLARPQPGLDRLYAALSRHGMLGARIPPEQRWQLAAYVASLSALGPDRRRRQALDQAAEPQGAIWPGPLQ